MGSTKVIKRFESNQNKTHIAKIIGLSFIAMFFLGIFAEFVVRTQLIEWENPMLTYTNIQNSLGLFNAGISAFIVIIFLDVVLSIAFYVLLSTINKLIALLMVSLKLVYVALKGSAIIGLILAKDIYSSAMAINVDQIEIHAAQAMQFLKMHNFGFGIALIFFGFHLTFLALLLYKVSEIPKVIVWMLLAAGIGYGLNSMVLLFATDFGLLSNIIIAIFIIPMTFSELLLGLWFWIKRKKVVPLL